MKREAPSEKAGGSSVSSPEPMFADPWDEFDKAWLTAEDLNVNGGMTFFELLEETNNLEWRRLRAELLAELGPLPRPTDRVVEISPTLYRRMKDWYYRIAYPRPPGPENRRQLIAHWIREHGSPVASINIVESNNSRYTSTNNMGVLAAYFAVARRAFEKGLSVAELDEAIDDKLAAKAAAHEMTTRATAQPRPDWIEAHNRGVTVPEFIKDAFAVELRDGSMHRGLFSRYENLRRDFYSHKRSNELPDWLKAMPTKAKLNTQRLAQRAEAGEPVRPASRPRTEEQRLYDTAVKRRTRAGPAV